MERLPKREYPIERVVNAGSDEKDYEIVLKFLRERFGKQDFLQDIECKKDEEEEKIIGWINEETNNLFEAYGVRPLDVPSKNIHIIPETLWPKSDNWENKPAFYDDHTQSILYRDCSSRSLLAYRLFHEEIHIKSHQAIQLIEENGQKKFELYREGLVLVSKKRDNFEPQFRRLNEAVVETLAVNFWEKIAQDPRFKDEMEELECIKTALREEGEESEQLINEICAFTLDKEELETIYFGFPIERAALTILINKISEKNRATPKESETFDLFVKSMLTGHMVELGKLIDKTFGIGTFKKIGKMSSKQHNAKEFLEYVKTL